MMQLQFIHEASFTIMVLNIRTDVSEQQCRPRADCLFSVSTVFNTLKLLTWHNLKNIIIIANASKMQNLSGFFSILRYFQHI